MFSPPDGDRTVADRMSDLVIPSTVLPCPLHGNPKQTCGHNPQQYEKGVDTMFKYKSPLSRLLEGAGKAKEEDAPEAIAETSEAPEQVERSEPIADFNALRQALAGGNMATESYEETDDLIPEEQMPEFEEAGDATVEETAGEQSADETAEDDSDHGDQIVTLHVAAEDQAEDEDQMLAAVAESAVEDIEPEPETPASTEEVSEIVEEAAPVAELEPEAAEPKATESDQLDTPAPAPIPTPAEDRRSRVKTTFLGFDRADTHVQDVIETAEPVTKTEAAQQSFPVGWLVITSGPGRGASVTLTEGLMQIGRNDDQAIQLDFGDTGISRSSHAVIAYDPEDRKCYLGHGGKANLVRLNGKPVLSTVPLSSGDLIRISETSIRFAAFCDDGFDWRDAD